MTIAEPQRSHPSFPQQGWVAALRGFTRKTSPVEAGRCELCGAEILPGHQHLVEPAGRRLLCCCQACAVLFSNQAAAKYRRVPERTELLRGFHMSDLQWDALRIPIDLAFFFRSSTTQGVVGFYPSPAGATESLLSFAAWEALVADNPMLAELESDVEALLVNRLEEARGYYRVPIDRCYELVGLIRAHWQGLAGGAEVRDAIRNFFARIEEAARAPGLGSHA